MDTAVYFSNEGVQAIVGISGRNGVKITSMSLTELPEGVLINGVIIDSHKLKNILIELYEQKKIGKKIRVVIDSSNVLYKSVVVPFMNQSHLLHLVEEEFENLDREQKEYIFDYTVLSQQNSEGNGTILCCAMDSELLNSYIDLLESANLKMISCDIGLNCIIKYVNSMVELDGKTYILTILDKYGMIGALFVDGQYTFSNRIRILADYGTDDYIAEVMGRLSALKQFHKSESTLSPLECVYFCGVSNNELSRYEDAGISLNIRFNVLPDNGSIINQYVENDSTSPIDQAAYMFAAGCLMRK